jgi:hypothetical protein
VRFLDVLMSKVVLAKDVLDRNSKVLFGIFGAIQNSGHFPPLEFLNEFFMKGNDPCDQDGRMASWPPFNLTSSEYAEVKNWWLINHPGTLETDLESSTWTEWCCKILELNQ